MAARRRDVDELLVAALATGRTYAEAGQAAGVHERTVRRRMAEADFRARVAIARAELIDHATGELADSLTAATRTLRGLLADPEPRIRLGAAVKLLELAAKYHDATRPAAPPQEGVIIEYVQRIITTPPASAPAPG
jgi:hypothetical protein